MIGVGLVGFGMSGRTFHAPIINSVEGLRLKKVVERHANKSQEIYPEVEVVRTIDELLVDPDIEIVVITVPNKEHFKLAMKSINAGKNVIVEKPFTVTYNEAMKLVEASKEKGVILSVYHNRRFDADFITIKKLIADGKLGEIVNYEARFDRFRSKIKQNSWKEEEQPGSGLLYDLGSHLIDQALVLFGNPTYVTGFMSIERENGIIDDNFELIMEYKDKRVSLKAGMMVRDNSLRYVINGTKSTYVKTGIDVQEADLKAGKFPHNYDEWGKEPEKQYGKLIYEEDGAMNSEVVKSERGDYRLYYRDIREAILNKREPNVTGMDGANVIKVIECALRSRDEKRTISFNMCNKH